MKTTLWVVAGLAAGMFWAAVPAEAGSVCNTTYRQPSRVYVNTYANQYRYHNTRPFYQVVYFTGFRNVDRHFSNRHGYNGRYYHRQNRYGYNRCD